MTYRIMKTKYFILTIRYEMGGGGSGYIPCSFQGGGGSLDLNFVMRGGGVIQNLDDG